MHLHGYHFTVVGTDGYPLQPSAQYEKDTLNIGPGERYDIEFTSDNPGTWIFHCHILTHVQNHGVEPGGMITVLSVK
jgi:FtsP/CotA-like multicopper oxidase with cupredoxin domain